jgi:hypothetical protein
MAFARFDEAVQESEEALVPPGPAEEQSRQFLAWEQIETGRFMPRRTRGSFRGGVLG